MISQTELDRALARYKARKQGGAVAYDAGGITPTPGEMQTPPVEAAYSHAETDYATHDAATVITTAGDASGAAEEFDDVAFEVDGDRNSGR